MRQAIVTKYLGPTDFHGARVKAKADAGTITVSWDHALNVDENHTAAAKTLAQKFGWYGQWVGGGMPSKDGNCYVHMSPLMVVQTADNADCFNVPHKPYGVE